MSLKLRTSSLAASSDSAAKIALPFGCAHQLPTIGSPATASVSVGTGPCADASTTPCLATSFTHREPRGAARRRAGFDLRRDGARALARRATGLDFDFAAGFFALERFVFVVIAG
jgi:hypothetical protein